MILALSAHVSDAKMKELNERLERLEIRESDLIEKFVLGSGKGGQKMNKTSSCVTLKHIPTGIQVKCQQGRSRELNRFFARRELCERIEKEIFHQKTDKDRALDKIRRQKKRRSRKSQKKVSEESH